MAEDNQDRANEAEAEKEAEIAAEMERVGQDPDQVDAGTESLGKQSAASGEPREEEEAEDEEDPDAETSQEETQELPNEQQREQWEESGGDEELAEEATDAGE